MAIFIASPVKLFLKYRTVHHKNLEKYRWCSRGNNNDMGWPVRYTPPKGRGHA